ncbi:hypothetical protein WAI453_008047 [Rhynchosporium graminicola]
MNPNYSRPQYLVDSARKTCMWRWLMLSKLEKDVERELSKFEGQAAMILQKIKKANENKEAGISLTRMERNLLRKFLFIMKYRGPDYSRKYFDDDPQTYDHEDKHVLRAYVAEKGMKSPRELWLHNLRIILDLNMDAGGEWMKKLPGSMFPSDAALFIFHVQSSYMAFCMPQEKHDEFILTDQCYNVFEGPTNETFCGRTNEFLGATYLCYHEFGPISPKLIIVLRSSTLPNALEDSNSTVQRSRQLIHDMAAAQFPDPLMIKSVLADLPVAKAENSYTNVVDGKSELAPGESGLPMVQHKFFFRFWPISTRHVNTINFIILDNILHCKSIVYSTHLPFKRTLQAYLTTSAHGLKKVGIGEHGAHTSRHACLKKLSIVLRKLGAENVAIWIDEEGEASQPYVQSLDDTWLEVMKKLFEDQPELLQQKATSFWQAYSLLGGSKETFVKDLDQSWKMYKLVSQVARWTRNLDDSLRYQALTNATEFILQNLPRRVWLYVKHRRWMRSDEYALHQEKYIGTGPVFAAKTKALFRAAPEDEVALVNSTISPQDLYQECQSHGVAKFSLFPKFERVTLRGYHNVHLGLRIS